MQDSPAVFRASEIREQLDRILSSRVFVQSARMSRFLRFVVEQSLDGQPGALKETSIAVAVFDRDLSFDPKADPVVRNEARRLRGKLERYYATEGLNDRLRIGVPKGGYSACFEPVSGAAEPAPAVETSLPEQVPTPSLAPAKRGGRPWIRIALAASGLLIGGIAYFQIVSRLPVAPAVTLAPLTSYAGQESQPSISPDGTRLAFVWDDGGKRHIYQKTITGPAVRLTTGAESELRPVWSPDGRWIAFVRAAQPHPLLVIVGAGGGAEREVRQLQSAVWEADLAPETSWAGLAWSHDGAWLVVSDRAEGEPGHPLYLVSVNSGESRRITNPGAGESDGYPAISRDGASLAFVRLFSHSAGEIFTVPPGGGNPNRLLGERQDIRGLSWTPGNRRLVFSSNRNGSYGLWTISAGGAHPVLIPTAGESATDPVVSPDGKWLAYTDSSVNENIWRRPAGQPGEAQKFIFSSRQNNSAQYSPDGRRIAFVSDRSGSWEVWTASADGSGPAAVTSFHGPMVGTPRWSPDSSWLTFDARPEGHSAVFVVRAGGGPAQPLEHNAFENKRPSWSRDGKWIYFASNRAGVVQLWKAPLAGGGPAQLVCDCSGYDAQESFDGRTVYFLNSELHLWQCPVGDVRASIVPGLEHVAPGRAWTVGRDGIYFADRETGRRTINLYSFSTRRPAQVAQSSRDLLFGTPNLSVSPDGRWILFAQQDDVRSDLMQARGVF